VAENPGGLGPDFAGNNRPDWPFPGGQVFQATGKAQRKFLSGRRQGLNLVLLWNVGGNSSFLNSPFVVRAILQGIYFLLSFVAVGIVIRWCLAADGVAGAEYRGLLAIKQDAPQPSATPKKARSRVPGSVAPR
jgi:hypothetical protein